MNIAQRIAALRRQHNMSQEELADRLGVSRQAVSKWEQGQNSPDLEKILQLSTVFGVTTDYLLKGVEPTAESTPNPAGKSAELASRILYIASAAFLAIGLLCAFSGWYEEQMMSDILAG